MHESSHGKYFFVIHCNCFGFSSVPSLILEFWLLFSKFYYPFKHLFFLHFFFFGYFCILITYFLCMMFWNLFLFYMFLKTSRWDCIGAEAK